MTDDRLKMQQEIARGFRVPDHLIGLPSPWWRRLWYRITRRPR